MRGRTNVPNGGIFLNARTEVLTVDEPNGIVAGDFVEYKYTQSVQPVSYLITYAVLLKDDLLVGITDSKTLIVYRMNSVYSGEVCGLSKQFYDVFVSNGLIFGITYDKTVIAIKYENESLEVLHEKNISKGFRIGVYGNKVILVDSQTYAITTYSDSEGFGDVSFEPIDSGIGGTSSRISIRNGKAYFATVESKSSSYTLYMECIDINNNIKEFNELKNYSSNALQNGFFVKDGSKFVVGYSSNSTSTNILIYDVDNKTKNDRSYSRVTQDNVVGKDFGRSLTDNSIITYGYLYSQSHNFNIGVIDSSNTLKIISNTMKLDSSYSAGESSNFFLLNNTMTLLDKNEKKLHIYSVNNGRTIISDPVNNKIVSRWKGVNESMGVAKTSGNNGDQIEVYTPLSAY